MATSNSRSPATRLRRATRYVPTILRDPGFGRSHTDHMVSIDYTEGKGWHDASVRAVRPDRAGPVGDGAALRPRDLRGPEGLPAGRTGRSCRSGRRPTPPGCDRRPIGSAIPELPGRAVHRVAAGAARRRRRLGAAAGGEASLYLRPFIFATEPGLGVRPANAVPLHGDRLPGRRLLPGRRQAGERLVVDRVRAGRPGGTGAAKFGGNYAASLAAQAQAAEKGCDQVVWLDAIERRWVEEMGGMNLFFVFGSGARRGGHARS